KSCNYSTIERTVKYISLCLKEYNVSYAPTSEKRNFGLHMARLILQRRKYAAENIIKFFSQSVCGRVRRQDSISSRKERKAKGNCSHLHKGLSFVQDLI
ncbi:hypothetical protein C0J52_26387, partial [Blattella germanica]